MKPDEYDYARDLAYYLWRKHYKKDAPDWEPFEDLYGVLSQIDNMTTGLTRRSTLTEKAAAFFRKLLNRVRFCVK